jgi:hypothetical protein
MRDFSKHRRWLSINTVTVRKQGDLLTIIDACARRPIRAISPWHDQVALRPLGTRDSSCEAIVGAACSRQIRLTWMRPRTITSEPLMKPRRSVRPASSSSPVGYRNSRIRARHLQRSLAQPTPWSRMASVSFSMRGA